MDKSNHWRIGLLSDLHGNLAALQAALAALKNLGVEDFVCLGDVATYGPNPVETVAALHDLHCPVVMGNTDAWALDPHPFAYRDEDTPIIYALELWSAQQLGSAERDFLRTFAPTLSLEVGQTTLLCYHGSPRSALENIRATTPDAELDTIFAGHTATVAIGGHTHTQMVRRHHDMIIVNPGSIGAPVAFARGRRQAYYPPWTEFGLLEITESKLGPTLQIQLLRTPIDVDALMAAVYASDMPHAEWYIAHWQRQVPG